MLKYYLVLYSDCMNQRISSYFFFVLLFSAFIAAVIIFLPFLTPVVLAAAVAVIAFPLYRAITRIFGSGQARDSFAALITVIIVLIVILIPVFLIVGRLYVEIQSLYGLLTDETCRSQIIDNLNNFSQSLSDDLFNVFPAYSFDSLNVTEYLKEALQCVFTNLDTIFTSFAKVTAYAFVFLLSLFYFLRDGAVLKRRFIAWSPLLDSHDEHITNTLKRAVRSVFAGTIVVSVIQGILTGIGFFIFGIPAPTVWGSTAAIAAFIPGIGTGLVIIPGIIYLLIIGNYAYAIGLTIWGVLAVGLVDNLLGPYLVNRGVGIHPFLILISVLGGLATFGPIGFVLGPLILAFLVALLDIYRNAFTNVSN